LHDIDKVSAGCWFLHQTSIKPLRAEVLHRRAPLHDPNGIINARSAARLHLIWCLLSAMKASGA